MKNQFSEINLYDSVIRLFILILIVAWCLMIMMPFVSIVLWSLIFSFALGPLHNALTKKFGSRPKLASSVIVGSALLILIIPAVLLIGSLFEEVKQLKVMYNAGDLTIPPPTEKIKNIPLIGDKLYETWQGLSVNVEEVIMKYKTQLTGVGKTIVKGILGSVSALIQMVVAFVISGILLVLPGVDKTIRQFFRKLAGARGDEFAETMVKTVGSVVKGIIGVALILALLHGIIFMIAGVPFAGLWTLLVFVLCVLQIPVIFVTLPVIIYLFAQHGLTAAIVWAVVLFVAGLSDNVLKPLLLGKGAPVPMLVIFIGVIGGFILSGFIGLFTGAIVMSIGYKLFIGWIDAKNESVS